jgi:hypothetical protein
MYKIATRWAGSPTPTSTWSRRRSEIPMLDRPPQSASGSSWTTPAGPKTPAIPRVEWSAARVAQHVDPAIHHPVRCVFTGHVVAAALA